MARVRVPHGAARSTPVSGGTTARAPDRREAALQVAAGGAGGALARVGLVALVVTAPDGWPWGVLAANLAGTLLLGWLVGRVRRTPRLVRWLPLLGTGLAGALTTFSALAVDLAQLAGTRPVVAAGYALTSLGVGLLVGLMGLRLGEGTRAC